MLFLLEDMAIQLSKNSAHLYLACVKVPPRMPCTVVKALMQLSIMQGTNVPVSRKQYWERNMPISSTCEFSEVSMGNGILDYVGLLSDPAGVSLCS